MVAVASHPRGPFNRSAAPVPASMYPGKDKAGDEDGNIFLRRPGDPLSHAMLVFETKAAPPESKLPCGHHKSQRFTYCTRAVRTTDGGSTFEGGEVLLGTANLPRAAAGLNASASDASACLRCADNASAAHNSSLCLALAAGPEALASAAAFEAPLNIAMHSRTTSSQLRLSAQVAPLVAAAIVRHSRFESNQQSLERTL